MKNGRALNKLLKKQFLKSWRKRTNFEREINIHLLLGFAQTYLFQCSLSIKLFNLLNKIEVLIPIRIDTLKVII